jgi:hypothetical protein
MPLVCELALTCMGMFAKPLESQIVPVTPVCESAPSFDPAHSKNINHLARRSAPNLCAD